MTVRTPAPCAPRAGRHNTLWAAGGPEYRSLRHWELQTLFEHTNFPIPISCEAVVPKEPRAQHLCQHSRRTFSSPTDSARHVHPSPTESKSKSISQTPSGWSNHANLKEQGLPQGFPRQLDVFLEGPRLSCSCHPETNLTNTSRRLSFDSQRSWRSSSGDAHFFTRKFQECPKLERKLEMHRCPSNCERNQWSEHAHALQAKT